MTIRTLIGASATLAMFGVLSGVLVSDVDQPAQGPPSGVVGCRHDASELPTDRLRREQAFALARGINTAQRLAVEQTGHYQPLDQLRDLPQTPDRFEVSFYSDGSGYIFLVKDERDPCHFRILSDHDGRLYEVMLAAAEIAS